MATSTSTSSSLSSSSVTNGPPTMDLLLKQLKSLADTSKVTALKSLATLPQTAMSPSVLEEVIDLAMRPSPVLLVQLLKTLVHISDHEQSLVRLKQDMLLLNRLNDWPLTPDSEGPVIKSYLTLLLRLTQSMISYYKPPFLRKVVTFCFSIVLESSSGSDGNNRRRKSTVDLGLEADAVRVVLNICEKSDSCTVGVIEHPKFKEVWKLMYNQWQVSMEKETETDFKRNLLTMYFLHHFDVRMDCNLLEYTIEDVETFLGNDLSNNVELFPEIAKVIGALVKKLEVFEDRNGQNGVNKIIQRYRHMCGKATESIWRQQRQLNVTSLELLIKLTPTSKPGKRLLEPIVSEIIENCFAIVNHFAATVEPKDQYIIYEAYFHLTQHLTPLLVASVPTVRGLLTNIVGNSKLTFDATRIGMKTDIAICRIFTTVSKLSLQTTVDAKLKSVKTQMEAFFEKELDLENQDFLLLTVELLSLLTDNGKEIPKTSFKYLAHALHSKDQTILTRALGAVAGTKKCVEALSGELCRINLGVGLSQLSESNANAICKYTKKTVVMEEALISIMDEVSDMQNKNQVAQMYDVVALYGMKVEMLTNKVELLSDQLQKSLCASEELQKTVQKQSCLIANQFAAIQLEMHKGRNLFEKNEEMNACFVKERNENQENLKSFEAKIVFLKKQLQQEHEKFQQFELKSKNLESAKQEALKLLANERKDKKTKEKEFEELKGRLTKDAEAGKDLQKKVQRLEKDLSAAAEEKIKLEEELVRQKQTADVIRGLLQNSQGSL